MSSLINSDAILIEQYVRAGSDSAFREVVERHLPMVYATALRITAGDTHLAQDVAQTVFTQLARNAASLHAVTSLGGWLHGVAHNVAAMAVRTESRRRIRERTAMEMHELNENSAAVVQWNQLAPVLDEALKQLDDRDRTAIVLRYLEASDLRSVGAALGMSDDAAQKRIARALEKLRDFLTRRGLSFSAVMLAATLDAGAKTPVPAGLAAAVAASSVSGTAPAAVLTTGIHSTSAKIAAVLAVGAFAAGTVVYMVQNKPAASVQVPNAVAAPTVATAAGGVGGAVVAPAGLLPAAALVPASAVVAAAATTAATVAASTVVETAAAVSQPGSSSDAGTTPPKGDTLKTAELDDQSNQAATTGAVTNNGSIASTASGNTLPSIIAMAAGGYGFSYILKSDGSLWGMGYNSNNLLGEGTYNRNLFPKKIITSGVIAVAAGFAHALYIKSDGSLWGMGRNDYGQLGDSNPGQDKALVPQQIVTSDVTVIAATGGNGGGVSFFIKSDGSLWGMGNRYTDQGEFPDGTTNKGPKQIIAANVTAISAGESGSYVLESDGSLWSVGVDARTATGFAVPKRIVASGVTAIAAGVSFCEFITSGGVLWTIGDNNFGQVGYGVPTSDSPPPKKIVAGGVTAIAAAGGHSLFIKSDGSLWGIGDNGQGQLGDGLKMDHTIPKEIVSSEVIAVAISSSHSLFLKKDGSLWAMGDNSGGELGDGTMKSRSTPEQVYPVVTSP